MSKTLMPYPISDKADFRAWALDHPKANALLNVVIFRWRVSNIKKRDCVGPWSVYPRERWAEWAGLSVPQVKRELHRLETDRLIRRVRGRFQGATVRTYLQPTILALEHAGKSSDRARLGVVDAPMDAPTIKPIAAPPAAPVNEPTDYTSLPYTSKEGKQTISTKGVHTHPKDKGKAGEDVKDSKLNKQSAKTDAGDEDDEDDINFYLMHQQMMLKKAKLWEAKFPRLTGKHETKVKYPADLFGDKWYGYSIEAKTRVYKKYRTYVQNFYDAQKVGPFGSAMANSPNSLSDWTDEDDDALIAACEKKKAAISAGK
jgi:hypothetical protein